MEPRMTTHDPTITRVSGRGYGGKFYRFVCSCGARTPLMSRHAAMLARDRHAWEHHIETEPA